MARNIFFLLLVFSSFGFSFGSSVLGGQAHFEDSQLQARSCIDPKTFTCKPECCGSRRRAIA